MFDVWHIGIPVRNLEESLNFYVSGLGFEFLGYYEKTMGFVCPPGRPFTIELMEWKEDREGFDKKPHHLAFECENIEKYREALISGGRVGQVPEIKPSNNGMSIFALKDPDGITLQFYQGSAGFNDDIRPSIAQHKAASR